jgi:hypothetical protein
MAVVLIVLFCILCVIGQLHFCNGFRLPAFSPTRRLNMRSAPVQLARSTATMQSSSSSSSSGGRIFRRNLLPNTDGSIADIKISASDVIAAKKNNSTRFLLNSIGRKSLALGSIGIYRILLFLQKIHVSFVPFVINAATLSGTVYWALLNKPSTDINSYGTATASVKSRRILSLGNTPATRAAARGALQALTGAAALPLVLFSTWRLIRAQDGLALATEMTRIQRYKEVHIISPCEE